MLLIAVLFFTSYIGIIIAEQYKKRVNELKEMKKAFNILETKIRYTYKPIPDIFLEISNNVSDNISEIFKQSANQMEHNENSTTAWINSVSNSKTSLKNEDLEVIKGLGKLLGKPDVEGQISQIALTNTFIEEQIEKAEKEYLKNAKLYKTLGIVCGLALVIILI